MSVHKKTLNKRLQEQTAALEAITERLEGAGFICPYARGFSELGETEDMLEYDEDGNGKLPDFCSMVSTKDYFGEHDCDCTGAKDGKSCWLHYYGVIDKEPRKFRRITRRNKRLRAAKPELIFLN